MTRVMAARPSAAYTAAAMRGIGRIGLWLALWPVLFALWLRRRGRTGRVLSSVWIGFWVLVICLAILNSPPPKRTHAAPINPPAHTLLVPQRAATSSREG